MKAMKAAKAAAPPKARETATQKKPAAEMKATQKKPAAPMKVMNQDKIKNLPQKLQDIWWKMLHAANDECKVMVERTTKQEDTEKQEENEVKYDETNVGK